ncbi:M23 family metallopeptidase [Candidatus Nomurabacteria bacterium]|nr:M23 family metallopeptidase [Candidatus Nomurabacteria bacterium]
MKKRYLFFTLAIFGLVFFAGRLLIFSAETSENVNAPGHEAQAEVTDREVLIEIESGMTFSTVAENAGIGGTLMMNILEATEDVYDLTKIRAGKSIAFYFDRETEQFKKMIYEVNSESELYVEQSDEGLTAEVKEIDYEIRIKTVEGTIDSSLYQSALDQNIDIRAIIELADVFAWTIDFGMGIREGDTYKFIYEERYRDGEYVMPGKIIAALFNNDGEIKEGYYFKEGIDEYGDEIDGYYDLSGQSLQKMFLKNPVDFKYISSGFTTGQRYVEAFNVSTGHRAIDYAAAIGTPIRAVGDGVVTGAGWNSHGYGNLTSIRHNGVYSSNYAHQSKIYVKVGQHVKQGEIIGAVGSTGFSTGPHLHFEIVKNGTKINPLTLDLPADKSIAEDNLENFLAGIDNWRKQLHAGE